MNFSDVFKQEKAAAERMATRAAEAGLGIVSRLLTTAATLAVAAVHDDDPPQAVHRLRTSSALLSAIDTTAQAAQRQAFALITEAIISGYADDAAWRSRAVEESARGLSLAFRMTEADRVRLRGYPVLGHTAAEIAVYLATQLRYGIDGALAMPLSGKTDHTTMPAMLGEAGRLHSERVGNAVREAYFGGVQAATRDLGAALTSRPTLKKVS